MIKGTLFLVLLLFLCIRMLVSLGLSAVAVGREALAPIVNTDSS